MTQTIRVALKTKPYSIVIGHGILADLPKYLKNLGLGKDAVIISHPVIAHLYGRPISQALLKAGYSVKVFNVPEGEKSKSAAYALRLIEQIASYDVNRNIVVVALGGGVIGDLAGFVAAIYKRGIPYVQIPTTLLAQIDSAIGGKTAIDLKFGKNLVGAFYQPKLVFTDTKVLKTLNRRQICNGLAEAIKYGVIKDARLFKFIEARHPQFYQCEAKALNKIVCACAAIKARVVVEDEFETKGIRTILNFGHTVGHAIEAAGRYQYHHGEAVGLGMRVAARLSVAQGLLSVSDEARLNRLMTAVGLPQQIKGVKISAIMDIMRHDKKFVGGRNRFVLAHGIGKTKIVENIPADMITAAIKSINA